MFRRTSAISSACTRELQWHRHEPRGVLLHAPFAGIQKPEAFCRSRFVRAGSAKNLAGVFQKTALFSAGEGNFKSLASTSSAASAFGREIRYLARFLEQWNWAGLAKARALRLSERVA